MSENTVEMPLPQLSEREWRLAIDTDRASPEDIVAPLQQRQIKNHTYRVTPRSVVVLESR
jgi:hypothetical protein